MLFVLLFNTAGVFIVFKIEQAHIRKAIKHRIKAGISEDDLHHFGLSLDDYDQLDWVRPRIEFRSGNCFYDIVHSACRSDSIHLYCVNDKEESILFAELDMLMQKQMEQESNNADGPLNKVVKIFKSVYVSDGLCLLLNPDNSFDLIKFHELCTFFSSPYLEHLTPPPDTV